MLTMFPTRKLTLAFATVALGSTAMAQNPICDAGGTMQPNGSTYYPAECNGPLATVQLDGTASSGTGTLTFFWSICPEGGIDDPFSPTPVVSLDMTGSCMEECGGIQLTVTDDNGSSTCKTAILITDTLPPVITCPPDVIVAAGDPTDPSATGSATADDMCAGSVPVTYSDVVVGNVITRTWSADDGCGVATCDQTITIEEPPVEEGPGLDIKPTSCPNPIQVNSGGVVPVALTGALDFDVTQVDTSSLLLARDDGVGSPIAPSGSKFPIADTAQPFTGELCDCHTFGGDGYDDLNMKFDKQELVSAFLLAGEANKTYLQLNLTGMLLDGTPFEVSDCIRVQNK